MGLVKQLLGIFYLILGLYLVNSYFEFVSLAFLEGISHVILLLAGILVLFHGIKFFFKSSKKKE